MTGSAEPMVRIHYWAGARDAAGVEADEVGAGTLADVLAAALAARPGLAPVLRACSVFVNGEHVAGAPHGVDRAAGRGVDGPLVPAGSTVEILPPFAGG